jgi:hypothetical protein
VGGSAVKLLVTPGARSAWCKAAEAKAAALHPERYQSSLSKLSTNREGEGGKEAQAIGLASQSDQQKRDGQTGDRQTG